MEKRLIIACWVASLAMLLQSCVYDFVPVVPDGKNYLVVNGDILIGEESRVSISRSAKIGEKMLGNLRADAVYVEGSDGSVYSGSAKNDNTYDIDLSRAASAGCDYRLVIEMDGSVYESEWSSVLQAAAIDSVSYTINDRQDVMTINVSVHSDADNRYYRWMANQVWEYHAPDHALAYYDPTADSILFYEYGQNDYFCWNAAFVSDLLIASTEQLSENRLVQHALYSMHKTEQRASYLYSVELIQEAISEKAYRFYNALRNNSRDVGGLFSPQPSEVRGNIVNRKDSSELVLGYISVTKPAKQRIFIDCVKLGFPAVQMKDPYSSGDTNPFRLPLGTDWKSYFQRGYQVLEPVMDDNSNLIIGWRWIRTSCVRCTSQGGTKKKPDWWPNDHQ